MSSTKKKYLTVIYDLTPGSSDAGDILLDPNVRHFFWSDRVTMTWLTQRTDNTEITSSEDFNEILQD